MNHLTPSSNSYTVTVTQDWEDKLQQDNLHFALSTLEESSALYQSCIDHEAIQLNGQSEQTQTQGGVLLSQLTNLVRAAQTLHQILQVAKRENTGLVTTGFTLGAGLTALWQGQIPWGLALTGAALSEVKKIIMHNFTTSGEAKDLIGEVKAGLLLIQQLEESQKSSLDTIKQQIEVAEGQLDDIKNQLNDIANLATEGNKDAEVKKQEAMRLSQQSANAYRQALYNLQQSQSNLISISEDFNSVIQELQELIKEAKSDQLTPEDFEKFVTQTQDILEKMIHAQDVLQKNQKLFNQGFQELHEASRLNKEALTKHLEAGSIMSRHLLEIQMKAKMDSQVKETKNHLKAAKEEVEVVKQRAEDIQEVAQHERKKLEEVQQQLENEWGTTSILVGTTVATVGTAVGGGAFSVPLGFGAAAVTHYTRRIHKFVGSYFNQENTMEDAPKKLLEMKLAYNPTSTGWGGYILGLISRAQRGPGRPSKTAGIVAINIGNEKPATYKFNKKATSEQGKMDERDIKQLNDDLRQQLKDGKINHQECLTIINSLASVQIEGEPTPIVLIEPNCVFLKDLKRECERNLKPLA